jgi:multiple sugar transport system substrate-binding protein
MMRKRFRLVMLGLICLFLLLAGACGGKSAEQAQSGTGLPPPVPITLTFYSAQGAVLEQFGALDLLKAKFPHITFEVINSQAGQRYPDLIAAGKTPDIIYEANSLMKDTIIAYGLNYDLDELVKKHKVDLNRFEPNVLSQAKYSNSEGKLYGLPYSVNRYALVYNKDIFDKYGVPYPKDGMTWDEVYGLAQKVNRMEGSELYQGFSMNTPANYMLNNQLSLDPLDPKEDKAAVNTDGFKKLYENLKRFYELPNANVANNSFVGGKLAMMAGAVSTGQLTQFAQATQLNWDMASVPVFADKRDTGFKPAGLSLFISQTSKHKDEAFRVADYLTSEEFQTILARNGGGTTLASDKVRSQAGQDVPVLKGKNAKALYYYPFAPTSPPRANHLTNVSVNFTNSFAKMIESNTDVNTALRMLEEEVNKSIAETKAKTK